MSNRVQLLQPGDPRRVGPYRVVGRLGSGGMGTVFAALSAAGEQMAVKVIHPTQAADDEFRARFRREVQLSQRVAGPCLVPVHDADTEAVLPWLATPFVPGPTLDRHVAGNGPLSGAHLYALAAGTAAALGAIHAAGVVHRDVKPSNVILAPSGPQVRRSSPALALAQALQQAGAIVTIHDPQAVATATVRNPEFDYTDDLPGSLDRADLVVLATEWPEYRQADPQALVGRPANPLLVDCRTTLDPEPWRATGWTVHQLGRPGKQNRAPGRWSPV